MYIYINFAFSRQYQDGNVYMAWSCRSVDHINVWFEINSSITED